MSKLNILAVGAYERDNFGDLLFLEVLQRFSNDKAEITPSSIIYSDMRGIGGPLVMPYDALLKSYKFDAIWTVGGEIGGKKGLGYKHALSMDICAEAKNNESTKVFNLNDDGIAYLPDRSTYPLNKDTKQIINSVGVSGYKKILDKDEKEKITSILKRSTISVRDGNSEKWLTDSGVKHFIAPDVVHLLPLYFPREKNAKSNYFIFHCNKTINQYPPAKVAKLLNDLANEIEADVELFVAGVAPGHDDIGYYYQIIDEFNRQQSKHRISMKSEKNRNPIFLAQLIANAKLTISTSLHVRIISIAYNVPRIALANDKVAEYSKKWDPLFPVNIEIDDLLDTAEGVLMNKIDMAEISKNLQELALVNIKNLFSEIKKNSDNSNIDVSEILIQQVNWYKDQAIYGLCKINELDIANSAKLESVVAEKDSEISSILNSKSYKIGRIITAPFRGVKRLMTNDSSGNSKPQRSKNL